MLNESERKRSFRHCFLLFLCGTFSHLSGSTYSVSSLSLSLLPYDALLITWGREGKPKKVPTGERKRKRRRRGRISPPDPCPPPSPKYIFTILFLPSCAGDAAAALINTGREEKASGFFMGWGEDNKTWGEVDRWRW